MFNKSVKSNENQSYSSGVNINDSIFDRRESKQESIITKYHNPNVLVAKIPPHVYDVTSQRIQPNNRNFHNLYLSNLSSEPNAERDSRESRRNRSIVSYIIQNSR